MIKCLYYLRFWIKWANREQNLSPFNFIIPLLYYKTFHNKQICWRHTRLAGWPVLYIGFAVHKIVSCGCDLNHIFPNIFNANYGILVWDTFRNDSNCGAKIKAIFCGDIFNAKCGILAWTAVCYDANCDFKISHRMQYIKIWCHQRELTSTFFQDKNIALQWPF